MRFSSVVLAVAGLLVAAGCAGNRARGLDRPADLGAEWVWSAEALPSGDVKSSYLTIEKFMPATVVPDSVYAYTVRVTNVSKGKLNDLVISDTLPAAGYTLISTEPEAERSGGQLRWPVGEIGPGQSYTVVVTGHIQPGSGASSCASVTYVQPKETMTAAGAEKAAAEKAVADKAAAEKAAADKAAAEKKAAADKAVADKAAADKAAADKATAEKKAAADKAAADKAAVDKAAAEKKAAADKAAADKAAASKAAADKAAAEKAAADKSAAEKAAAGAAAAGGAAAGAAAAGGDRAAAGADKAAAGADKAAAEKKAAADKAASAPKLDLSMSMPAEVCAFDEVVFKMLLRNTGKTKATEVRVVDQFPEGLTVNGKKYVAFQVGELAPGAGREFTVRMKASKAGKFRNTATVTAAGGLKSEAAAETTVWKAALAVTAKPSADSVGPGKEATFSFTVTNSGDRAATDCTLRVTMTGADKVSGASDSGAVAGTVVTWKLGEIAKGASKTVTVKAVRAAAGAIDCAATGAGKCADPVSAKAKATVK